MAGGHGYSHVQRQFGAITVGIDYMARGEPARRHLSL